MKYLWIIALTLGMAVTNAAWSRSDATPKAKGQKSASSIEEKAFGKEGDPRKVSRTVKIDMADTMRYSPSEITVKRGETIRFEAKNSGKVMHEIVLGTLKELKEHAALMLKNPAWNMTNLIWRMSRQGRLSVSSGSSRSPASFITAA